MKMKVAVLSVFLALFISVPTISYAASLSSTQVNAIVAFLQGFGVDAAVIAKVEHALGAAAVATATLSDPKPAYVPTNDNVYPLGSLGYDLSFATHAYPVDPFGFAVIGTSGGRAFVDNTRMVSEYKWAQDFATRAAPTFYLNVNAPYGAQATNARVTSPKTCTTPFGTPVPSVSAGGTYPDPAPCAGYNFGYNTAAHAYAYAANHNVSASFWWLDIEEANSWSENTVVNDQVIQGAIDYLNSKGIRVGLYSVPYMWRNIAGSDFSPTQTIAGKMVPIPNWFPIGIASRTEALNACHSKAGFTSGSPVWIIQYEQSSTAVDQNVAC